MASDFKIAIINVHTGDIVAEWTPRQTGPMLAGEIITRAISKRGIGFFRTENHVKEAISEAIEEFLLTLKKQV